MEQNKKKIDELVIRYLQGTLSDNDRYELDQWIQASGSNKVLFDQLTDGTWVNAELQKIYGYDEDKGWQKITEYHFQTHQGNVLKPEEVFVPARKLWRRIAVAASVILFVGLGGYFYLANEKKDSDKKQELVITPSPLDIKAPESNRAVITLANGQKVYLDSVSNGTLARQGHASLAKLSDGNLAYTPAPGSGDMVFNTIDNPRGSKAIHLTLTDGTKVWLNSETSMRFPVNFAGNERRVEITGEAYFEVAKAPSKPFRITANKMEVEVLGTHFNVNAYKDEEMIRTTLLEGRVRLNGGGSSILIAPGEQAQFSGSSFKVDREADIDKVMAWKNGMFEFDNTELAVIMRQISRWYNVNIVFEKAPGTEKYGGGISRQVSLTGVLKMLEANGIMCELSGNKVVVRP